MIHPVQCRCGAFRARLEGRGPHNRVICYCADCQAFARALDKASETLDSQGGTEVVQVMQSRLRLEQGEEHLAVLRLSESGMLRWYAACCATPIGNTMFNPRMSFIGLVHTCLDPARMDTDFGPGVAVANVKSALGEPKPQTRGFLGVLVRLVWIMASGYIRGSWRGSPLFDESGSPRAIPRTLTAEELANARRNP
ncbi:hypothetical protein HCU01_40810 [Halomonas cupida]|uniref:CENP-V/GFA domain-containing protein n=1 Tax=Halomonas cupida TaxID=44933 RepID=A0A1M7MKZ1_9GAMM|nr:DUF6151 family protein [Halomonas cupida]GEN26132.1 hypothetical protein HCU01_40810 [Halomonas cupida]SHM91530.1 hypothetical protein SAMN05660971_04249 [Halomonas cupida]